MLPACLRLADDVFPRVRAHAARRLVDAGWSQQRAGKALGLSQAMVSKHLASPPPSDGLVERLADELAQEVLDPTAATAQPSPWCTTLAMAGQRPGADAAVQDILAAERLLLAKPPLRVMPQVGLNLAVALPAALGPGDVLAFPGRLVEAGGRLLRPAPPAGGGAGRRGRELLAARRRWGTTAVANVRGGSDVAAAAKRLGWAVATVRREAKGHGEEALLQGLAAMRVAPAAVHDPGAVGLEPCLYILGDDAEAVANAIHRLDNSLVIQ